MLNEGKSSTDFEILEEDTYKPTNNKYLEEKAKEPDAKIEINKFMDFIKIAACYVIGIFFLLISIPGFFDHPLLGLGLLLIAFLYLPPSRRFFFAKNISLISISIN